MSENNPDVVNPLAKKLGLSSELQSYDVYSLHKPKLLTHIPRPSLAFLVLNPITPAWDRICRADAANKEYYTGFGALASRSSGSSRPSATPAGDWPTYSLINGLAIDFIKPDSDFAVIRSLGITLDMTKRAELLYNNEHSKLLKSAEQAGDSYADPTDERKSGHLLFSSRVEESSGARRGEGRVFWIGPGSMTTNTFSVCKRLTKHKENLPIKRRGGGEGRQYSGIALARRP